MNIDQMLAQFTSVEELKAYSNSQYQAIIQLTKKLNEKEEEIKHLQKLLENGVPLLDSKIEIHQGNITDEELICIEQLKILKKTAVVGELTKEEASKVEIYVKVLQSIRARGKEKEEPFKKLNDNDLMKLLEKETKNAE